MHVPALLSFLPVATLSERVFSIAGISVPLPSTASYTRLSGLCAKIPINKSLDRVGRIFPPDDLRHSLPLKATHESKIKDYIQSIIRYGINKLLDRNAGGLGCPLISGHNFSLHSNLDSQRRRSISNARNMCLNIQPRSCQRCGF